MTRRTMMKIMIIATKQQYDNDRNDNNDNNKIWNDNNDDNYRRMDELAAQGGLNSRYGQHP